MRGVEPLREGGFGVVGVVGDIGGEVGEGTLCVGDAGGDCSLLLFVCDVVGDAEEDRELGAGRAGDLVGDAEEAEDFGGLGLESIVGVDADFIKQFENLVGANVTSKLPAFSQTPPAPWRILVGVDRFAGLLVGEQGVGQARIGKDALGEFVGVFADSRIDALKGKCERVAEIFPAQREGGGQHLDKDGHEEARREQDDDEGDEGIEALEHIGGGKRGFKEGCLRWSSIASPELRELYQNHWRFVKRNSRGAAAF